MSRRTIAVIAALMIAGALGYTLVSTNTGVDQAAPPTLTSTTTPTPSAPTPTPSVQPPVAAGSTNEFAAPTSADAQVEERAILAARTVFSWRPGPDASPSDAYARARPWFTPKLADRTIVPERPERGPGVQWGLWAADGVVIEPTVTVGCSGCPPDTDNTIHRVVTIHQNVLTADGTVVSTVEPDTTVWLTFVRVGADNWLIDEFRY